VIYSSVRRDNDMPEPTNPSTTPKEQPPADKKVDTKDIVKEALKEGAKEAAKEVAKEVGGAAGKKLAKKLLGDETPETHGGPVIALRDSVCACGQSQTLTKLREGTAEDTYWWWFFQTTRDQMADDVRVAADDAAKANAAAAAEAFGNTFVCQGGSCPSGKRCPKTPAVYVGTPQLTKPATVKVTAGWNNEWTTISAVAEASCDVTVFCACL
jgi:hypothetical protein